MTLISATPDGPGQGVSKRNSRVLSGLGTGILGKGGSYLLLNALTIPITVRYLGAEQYGLWVTISTSIMMLLFLDIGIANTLTNLISEAYANDDRVLAGEYFTTALISVSAIAIVVGIVAALLWPHFPIGQFLGVHDPALIQMVSSSVEIALFLFLIGLPAGLAAKALAGYQELHLANLFAAAGSVLGLAAILGVVYFKGSLLHLVAGYSGGILAGSLGCLAWLCLLRKPWLLPIPSRFKRQHLKRILHSGGQFFMIQVAGVIVFNCDNLVISHFLTPTAVTPYNVTWRLTTYATALQALSSPTLWPAYAEAWTKRQMQWIRQTYRRVRWITIACLTGATMVLLPFGKTIIRVWAGPSAVPTTALLVGMCIWMVLYAITINQSCLMGATSRIQKQAISSFLAAIANLALTVWWVKIYGATGVIFATVISYLVFIVAIQIWEVRGILQTPEGAES